MKRGISTAYAILNTVLLIAGYALVAYFSWETNETGLIWALIGMVAGFVLAPLSHELGHLLSAQVNKMEYVYFKAFCFRFIRRNGKLKFSFASPFAADETQVIPECGGNMQKRAARYALGGLIVEGSLLFVLLAAAILCTALKSTRFELWAMIPYFAYLFLLNAIPAHYASGKTDAAVYRGIRKGEAAEQNMLAAMEIQGRLFSGKSFTEIPEDLYFSCPQLCEDEPLFAVTLDLQYRYYLEKGDFDKAADKLNRLAQTQAYLSDGDVEKIAAELTYMHAINGDRELARECKKLCEGYLQQNTATAHRVLAAYAQVEENPEEMIKNKMQAEKIADSEYVKGNGKFEKILLSRINGE